MSSATSENKFKSPILNKASVIFLMSGELFD
jgi:hypothetical protein